MGRNHAKALRERIERGWHGCDGFAKIGTEQIEKWGQEKRRKTRSTRGKRNNTEGRKEFTRWRWLNRRTQMGLV